ncbi:putative oxidoreductase [Paenibacillus pasadenensis]|uniref:Putative oxidoreductase n=1 Tax=Paenibacillus pasadenensis TaxID=217090 RepID=A0A2N5N6A7_9BACL|nr:MULTISPECIES: aldo/keto reductase [Paenibacillus]PLT45830.1 putative oxidoreductase [Paenibacillus pasadenensis]QGG56260.1 aldo/keto reductase [Paenibacillus sp. B01]
MEYRLLGRSGLVVSELCLGTMTFGHTASESDSARMIEEFREQGGNFLDTANVYVQGRSEEIVGRAIKPYRDEIVLATKVRMRTEPHVNGVGLSRKHIVQNVEASLKRLGTDYIDLYQVHVWDRLTPLDETLRALDDLVAAGKVRYIGCSNYLAWQMMKALSISDARGWSRFVSVQPQYSLACRDIERELVSLSLEENVGIIPWAPLAGGFLTGRYGKDKPAEGRLSRPSGESAWELRATDRNFAILDKLQEIAEAAGRTPAQTALRWLIQAPGVVSPIFGASTLEQFRDNMGAAGWTLPPDAWSELDEASRLPDDYPTRFIRKFERGLIPAE